MRQTSFFHDILNQGLLQSCHSSMICCSCFLFYIRRYWPSSDRLVCPLGELLNLGLTDLLWDQFCFSADRGDGMGTQPRCCSLTLAGSLAPHSHSLTHPKWDWGENWKSKSVKVISGDKDSWLDKANWNKEFLSFSSSSCSC